ncbi:MAG: hypothetical protein ACJASB_001852 [Shewanella psychromarinicola]|jgi:hypothetical protein
MNIMTLPPLPDVHALAVLLLVLLALFLFTRESIAIETSSLFILAVLSIGFTVFPYINAQGQHLEALQFFSGFGHEALVAVCALMIAGNGLVRTGALVPLGRILARLWRVSPVLSMLLTLLIGAFLSAFVNNVPIVVLLLPILISVSLRTGAPASGVLMPMGFATLVGGMSTSIGTSTNLLVVSVAADHGWDYSCVGILGRSHCDQRSRWCITDADHPLLDLAACFHGAEHSGYSDCRGEFGDGGCIIENRRCRVFGPSLCGLNGRGFFGGYCVWTDVVNGNYDQYCFQ